MNAAAEGGDISDFYQLTAERLRLALPLLSKHASDFRPQSYALWFAYVEAAHPWLTAALYPVVQEGRRLSSARTSELYDTLMVDTEEKAVARVRDALVHLLSQTASSTATASAKANAFRDVVQREGDELSSSSSGSPDLSRLIEQSHVFAHSLTVLSAQLEKSHEEVYRLREELEAVRHEAGTDALTTLFNRRSFDEALAGLCSPAASSAAAFSLILVDVDRFKTINDSLGHVFGDRVLRAIAETLKANVKGKDSVSRYGGEEFAVLLPDTDLKAATTVAEQLRIAVSAIRIRHRTETELPRISVSCGLTCRTATDSPSSILERADAALYEAKRTGRNRVVAA